MPSAGETERTVGGRPQRAGSARFPNAAERSRQRMAARTTKRSPLVLVALLAALAWGGAATWYALSTRAAVERLTDDQVDLRAAYDDKIRALTRRLVGVASHGLLEQDGLADRLADIIARQVELENRQSALTLMADRLTGTGVPRSGATGAPEPAPAANPALRLGAPSEPAPSTPPAGRRSSLDGPPNEGGMGSRRARDLMASAALPLRQRFEGLEASMSRLEGGQLRVLGAYARAAQGGTGLIQTALAEAGLKIAPIPEAPVPVTTAIRAPRRPPADPFEGEVQRVEGEFLAVRRWREIADGVPFRIPLPGGGLTSNFGTRKDPFTGVATMHAGMDFRSPVGTPVHAPGRGRVITAGVTGGYGNLVEIDHGHDLVTRYGHLSAFNVAVGQVVEPGEVIGLIGSTGRSTGPHLHYETRVSGSAVDPSRFVKAGLPLFGHQPDAPEAAPVSDDGEQTSDD